MSGMSDSQQLCLKKLTPFSKNVMQGKLITVRILCVHIETSFLWAKFVNKNRCISVRFVSEEVKALNLDKFNNSHNSFL